MLAAAFWDERRCSELRQAWQSASKQAITRTTSAVQALANDAIEYSRRAPAIDPILQQFELKPRPAPEPAPNPSRTTPKP
jgi:hypothetical protein